MYRRVLRMLLGAAGVALCGVATPALADVIDGDWCRGDGKTMSIRGPDITTPGGKQIQGDYSRHAFSYVVPAGEAGAGEKVAIVLRNEFLAHAWQGGPQGPMQEWKRCVAKVS